MPDPWPGRIHVLVNPGARRFGAIGALESSYSPWRARGVDVRVQICDEPSQLGARARAAVAGGAGVVVAAGGDGTISGVASALSGGDVPLGVLPIGTLNHFARDLGIPLDLDAAVAVTVEGDVRRVDVGEANGRAFINTATMGAYSDIVRARARWEPRVGRLIATAFACAAVLRRPPLLKLDVSVDGRVVRARMPVLWIGNNEYQLAWPEAGARRSLEGGRLTLVLVHEIGRIALLRQVTAMLRGRDDAPSIDVFHPREVVVSSRLPRLKMALDGERLSMTTPVRVRILPGGLLVVGPRPDQSALSTPHASSASTT